MRTLTSHPRTGALTTLLLLLIVPLFAYANLLCVAGGAFETCCEAESARHHDESDADHHDADHSPTKDSCFCATMNAVASPQTIVKPAVTHSVRLVDLSLLAIPNVPPKCATAAYEQDRKSTRLNSSHVEISYAVFCLKKKK